MKIILQRVQEASVKIDDKIYSSIKQGLLVFIGVEKGDAEEQAEFLANKIVDLRIFNDENDKMNLSVKDINGEILVVSQFTITSDCKKGKRPSFDNAATPEIANELYENFIKFLKVHNLNVKTGVFGADMKINLINDGPVTFILSR